MVDDSKCGGNCDRAFDDIWGGQFWEVKGAASSVTVNVTRAGDQCNDAIPWIDGVFMRLEVVGVCTGTNISVQPVNDVLTLTSLAPGMNDISMGFAGTDTVELWTVAFALKGTCSLKVYEIGFNGTCPVFYIPPSLPLLRSVLCVVHG